MSDYWGLMRPMRIIETHGDSFFNSSLFESQESLESHESPLVLISIMSLMSPSSLPESHVSPLVSLSPSSFPEYLVSPLVYLSLMKRMKTTVDS